MGVRLSVLLRSFQFGDAVFKFHACFSPLLQIFFNVLNAVGKFVECCPAMCLCTLLPSKQFCRASSFKKPRNDSRTFFKSCVRIVLRRFQGGIGGALCVCDLARVDLLGCSRWMCHRASPTSIMLGTPSATNRHSILTGCVSVFFFSCLEHRQAPSLQLSHFAVAICNLTSVSGSSNMQRIEA